MNFKVYIPEKKLINYYKAAIGEYEKRLTRYCKTKLILTKDELEIQKKINPKAYLIQIIPEGKSYTSEEFADKIQNLANSSISDIDFVIGKVANIQPMETINLTPLDLNSQIQGVMLYEQIYRAYRILNNEPYHK